MRYKIALEKYNLKLFLYVQKEMSQKETSPMRQKKTSPIRQKQLQKIKNYDIYYITKIENKNL